MQANQSNLTDKMDNIHKQWYDMMLEVVNVINGNFSKFMMSMGFAGEVELIRKNEVRQLFVSYSVIASQK